MCHFSKWAAGHQGWPTHSFAQACTMGVMIRGLCQCILYTVSLLVNERCWRPGVLAGGGQGAAKVGKGSIAAMRCHLMRAAIHA